jgi:hypothetical protein
MITKLLAATAACLSSVALIACGGGDDGGDTLSRADLVKQAEKICRDANKEADAVEVPSNIGDPAKAAPYFEKLAAVGRSQHDKLSDLKPPADLKTDYASFLKEEEVVIGIINGLADAAKAKDAKKGAELLQQVSANTAYKKAADKVGIGECAS